MPWVEIFAVFLVSHLVGDYLLQTESQAAHKRGGLRGDRASLRALLSHVATYALAFVPAFAWLAGDEPAGALGLAAGIVFIPHVVQDDGRPIDVYMSRVKRVPAGQAPELARMVDQTFHVLALFAAALVAGS